MGIDEVRGLLAAPGLALDEREEIYPETDRPALCEGCDGTAGNVWECEECGVCLCQACDEAQGGACEACGAERHDGDPS